MSTKKLILSLLFILPLFSLVTNERSQAIAHKCPSPIKYFKRPPIQCKRSYLAHCSRPKPISFYFTVGNSLQPVTYRGDLFSCRIRQDLLLRPQAADRMV